MITYPLNNIDYTAEDAELYFCTRESGVYDGESFEISATGVNNTVTIGTGIAWIHNTKFSGKVAALKEPKEITLSHTDSVYERIDSIVIQFNANTNTTDIVVKEGVPSANPSAVYPIRTASLYELHIYHIKRQAGSLAIGISDIVDQRSNPDYCGIMFDPISSIDESLSIRGLAADAYAVGNKLKEKLNLSGGTITGTAKFIPKNGTTVITSEVYRNLPSDSPTASYKTRNVIATNGAAMQFYKGALGEEPSEEVNRLTLTETDTQLRKPLTVSSGGTGRTSVTAGNYLVGNGTKGMVEKTPEAVLKDIGAASADDVAGFATETWVKNQIAQASVAGSGVDLSGYVTKDGKTDMTGKLKFKPATGTTVISPEIYRNLPTGSPTASYMTRNVIAANGAAMQFFKGDLGTDPGGTPINQLTLTETDTQLSKPLTLSSGGTGIDLSSVPDGAVIRKAGKGNAYLHYTQTNNGAMYAESENGTPIFGTLPIAQGGTGATKPADVITNLGINDYVVAQGTSGGWRYRKWNSGIAECFLSSEVLPTSGAGEKYHSVNLPFEFYNKSYHVSVTGVKAANQNYAHDFLLGDSSSNDGRTTTSIMFHFHYTLDAPYAVGFTIFVMGRWK